MPTHRYIILIAANSQTPASKQTGKNGVGTGRCGPRIFLGTEQDSMKGVKLTEREERLEKGDKGVQLVPSVQRVLSSIAQTCGTAAHSTENGQ